MTGYNTHSYCNVAGYVYVTSLVIINMTKGVDCCYLQMLFEFRIHRRVPTGIPARGGEGRGSNTLLKDLSSKS